MREQTTLTSGVREVSGRDLRLTWPRIALLVLLGLVTLSLLVYVGGGRETLAVLATVSWRWIVPALLIHYSGFVVRGRRWQQLLATMGHSVTYGLALTLLLAGWFVSALLPARAGDVLRIAVLRTQGSGNGTVPIGDSLGSIVLERLFDIFAILTLGALFAALALQGRVPSWVIGSYATGLLLLVIAAVGVLIAPRLLPRLRTLIRLSLLQRLLQLIEESVYAMRGLIRTPGTALAIAGESLYIWFCDAFLLWAVIRALGTATDFGATAFVALTVDIFAAVPLTPGGIGQVETAYGALLSLLSLPTVNLAATVLLVRFISYWSFLAISGVVTFAAGFGAFLHGSRLPPESPLQPADAIE